MVNMKFLLATRSVDKDEEVEGWRQETEAQMQSLYDEAESGVNVIVVSAKEAWNQHCDNGGRWNDYADFVALTKVGDDWRFDGILVPLIGENGPTINDAFVGKPTAEMIELALTKRRDDDEMFVYVGVPVERGDPTGQTGAGIEWVFSPVSSLAKYQAPKGKKNPPYKRWAELKFSFGGE